MRPRRTRNGVEIQMTADEVLQLAVNVANGWSLADLGLDEDKAEDALKKMLAEVWELMLDAHRKAVQRR
jgi:hypothetical protein